MGCELYDPFSYGNCVKDVVKSVAGDAFHSIAESFGEAADHAVNWLWSQLSAATAVHLGGPGFSREIGMTAAIAAVVALGLFLIQLIQSVLRRDAGGLARAGKGLVVAFVGGAVSIAVVNALLGATDALSAGVVRVATGQNLPGLGRLILGANVLTSVVTGPASLLLLSLGCIVATVVVYCALVVRKVLIVVTAVFAPVAFAGSLADITVSWTRRWIETTVALVVSKLILVLIFVIGYGMLVQGVGQSGSGAGQEVTQVISGVIVLLLAGFAPWVALKVVQFTGGHALQLRGLGATATAGLVATTRMAQKAAPYVARAATVGASSPGGMGGIGATTAPGADVVEQSASIPETALLLGMISGTIGGESAGAATSGVPADPSGRDDDAASSSCGEGARGAGPASHPDPLEISSPAAMAPADGPGEGGDS
jgi:hypothetical protein